MRAIITAANDSLPSFHDGREDLQEKAASHHYRLGHWLTQSANPALTILYALQGCCRRMYWRLCDCWMTLLERYASKDTADIDENRNIFRQTDC